MSERTLEDRLVDAVQRIVVENAYSDKDDRLRLAISVALTEARREGWTRARGDTSEESASRMFPLPTRTVRVLREERDPDGPVHGLFRYDPDRSLIEEWRLDEFVDSDATPTAARIALWHDLMQRPYDEREEPVDPAEVLP